MSTSSDPQELYRETGAEALALWSDEVAADPEPGRCIRFEYTSRGDRVPGRLWLPDAGAGPAPLILLQHGIGGSKEAPYMDARLPWVRAGAAVAAIDLPLHGERASAKLSERLITSLDFGDRPHAADAASESHPLWIEFARQSVLDMRRALDALALFPEVDPHRSAFAGFSLGAILGATFCAVDPRPRAAALALAGGGFGPAELDPCAHVAAIAPRPLLFVNASSDERIPRAATEALFDAAAEPKRIEWFSSGHSDLPGVALKAMWVFLQESLGLSR